VFLDIEMPGLNGFRCWPALNRFGGSVRYGLRGVRHPASRRIRWITCSSPWSRSAGRYRAETQKTVRHHGPIPIPANSGRLQQLKPKKELFSVPVRVGDRILFIRPEEASYFEAEDKYVYLYTPEGKRHLIDHPLTVLEEKLPDYFVRISRSVIVNRQYIREIQRHLGGRYVFLLNGKERPSLPPGPATPTGCGSCGSCKS
jgi:two-component system LytT family response regulator